MTIPQPSEKTVPFADLSNVKHRPSMDCMRTLEVRICAIGVEKILMPPAIAKSLSPLRILMHARCIAVNDDEQAVSTERDGPFKLRR